jgi:hypothetical protein
LEIAHGTNTLFFHDRAGDESGRIALALAIGGTWESLNVPREFTTIPVVLSAATGDLLWSSMELAAGGPSSGILHESWYEVELHPSGDLITAAMERWHGSTTDHGYIHRVSPGALPPIPSNTSCNPGACDMAAVCDVKNCNDCAQCVGVTGIAPGSGNDQACKASIVACMADKNCDAVYQDCGDSILGKCQDAVATSPGGQMFLGTVWACVCNACPKTCGGETLGGMTCDGGSG